MTNLSKKPQESEFTTYSDYIEAFVRDCVKKEVKRALSELGCVEAISTDKPKEESND
jgi:hypothetical protein